MAEVEIYELMLDTRDAHGGTACGRIRYRGSSLDGFGPFTTWSLVGKDCGRRMRLRAGRVGA
jgi:hypothetical protein